jgi:predicted nucleic acid-binding protein
MEKNDFLIDSNVLIHASKEPDGSIAKWLRDHKPYVTDLSYYECLKGWKEINNPIYQKEKQFLEGFFANAKEENRYLVTESNEAISQRAIVLNKDHNIKLEDAVIASTAEMYNYTLVTADNKKDFAPRLEKLNEQGKGNFKVQPYEYTTREETFQAWNQSSENAP